jgi:hypothetical protein
MSTWTWAEDGAQFSSPYLVISFRMLVDIYSLSVFLPQLECQLTEWKAWFKNQRPQQSIDWSSQSLLDIFHMCPSANKFEEKKTSHCGFLSVATLEDFQDSLQIQQWISHQRSTWLPYEILLKRRFTHLLNFYMNTSQEGCVSWFSIAVMKYLRLDNFIKKRNLFISQF